MTRERRTSSSIKTSATARSNSVCDMPLRVRLTLGGVAHVAAAARPAHADTVGLHDPRDRDDFVAAHDQGPRLTVGAGHLRVHEHVLDLLAHSGEPVTRAPCAYLKAW